MFYPIFYPIFLYICQFVSQSWIKKEMLKIYVFKNKGIKYSLGCSMSKCSSSELVNSLILSVWHNLVLD